MGTGPGDLYAVAQMILTASAEALDNIPLSDPGLEGAPDRAFVSPGAPAIDCCNVGQLTVHYETVSDAPLAPGNAQGRLIAGKKIQVGAVIIIARCVTTGDQRLMDIDTLPDPVDMEAAAEQSDADIWALENCLYGLWRSGDLFTLCGEVFFEGARSFFEGGCAGWRLNIRFSLDGYECVPSS
jgi:hypothetical protein